MAGSPNTANVFVGAPDRVTSGAIMVAPKGTAVPTAIGTSPNVAFKDLGYIGEDGVSIAQGSSWEKIKDWGGDQIRRFLTEFTGTLSFMMNETRPDVLKFVYGASNITTTAVSASTTKNTILVNSKEPDVCALLANILDGPRKVLIVAPLCQVTERQDLSFSRTSALQHGVTVETYPDAAGNSLYIYTDDGVTVP